MGELTSDQLVQLPTAGLVCVSALVPLELPSKWVTSSVSGLAPRLSLLG